MMYTDGPGEPSGLPRHDRAANTARFEYRWTGGPDVNSDERREPVDGLEPVVLLGSEMCENETAPVIPVGHDVNLMGHDGPVGSSGHTKYD